MTVHAKTTPTEHGAPNIRRVPIKDVRLDSSYQRDLDTVRVHRLFVDWDPALAGALILSNRAGILWCVDGQHRLAVMRERNELFCYAIVLDGLTQMEEAALFVSYNKNRKGLNAWDLFKGEQIAGHDDVLNIIRIVHVAGFRVDRTTAANHIGAVGALRRIYRLGSEPLLVATINVVREIWVGDRRALDGTVLEGLAVFLHSFRGEPQYREKRARDILETHTPVVLIRKAQEIAATRYVAGSSATNLAEAIREFYNSGLQSANKLGAIRRTNKLGVTRRSPVR